MLQVCASCDYIRCWKNQPLLNRNMPLCNLLMSGALSFSGCMASQTLRMLDILGVQSISSNTFFRHQKLYVIPTIFKAWKDEQTNTLRELKALGSGLVVSGDCRSDSPGHCAKYGFLYPHRGTGSNKVVDLQLVQVIYNYKMKNWFIDLTASVLDLYICTNGSVVTQHLCHFKQKYYNVI